MSNLSKVSDYELFAYVASGFWALAITDLLIDRQFIFGQDWTISEAALMFMASYIVGQILASPAQAIIERILVHKILLPPSIALLDKDPRLESRKLLRKALLRGYYRPLDAGIIEKIWHHTRDESKRQPSGEALFWQAYSITKNDSKVATRLGTFLKLYGFCRNMTFINLCGSVSFSISSIIRGINGEEFTLIDHPLMAGISLILTLGMLVRFLKFYRLYSVEIFVAYSAENSNEESRQ